MCTFLLFAHFMGFPSCLLRIRNLSSGHVHMVIFFINQLRYRHYLITFFLQSVQQRIQSICRIFRPIVAQDNRTISKCLMIQHRIQNTINPVVFPIQTIIICYRNKDKYLTLQNFFDIIHYFGIFQKTPFYNPLPF